METINTVELRDQSVYPDDGVLRGVLGPSFESYLALVRLYDDNGMTHEWRYYRDGNAWLCKVQKKKRTIVWMSAWKGYMQATVYFPEASVGEVCSLDISEGAKEKIAKAKRVGKSCPCTFEIRDNGALDDLGKVMQLKMLMK